MVYDSWICEHCATLDIGCLSAVQIFVLSIKPLWQVTNSQSGNQPISQEAIVYFSTSSSQPNLLQATKACLEWRQHSWWNIKYLPLKNFLIWGRLHQQRTKNHKICMNCSIKCLFKDTAIQNDTVNISYLR